MKKILFTIILIQITSCANTVKDNDSITVFDDSILSIIERIKKYNIPMIIYEDQISDKSFSGVNIEKDLHIFKNSCDLIITNRITDDLSDVIDKVFTRDLFGYD